MNAVLSLAALLSITHLQTAAQTVLSLQNSEEYTCKPSEETSGFPMSEVKVQKDGATGKLTAEVTFKMDVADVTYSSDLKYVETPGLTFPAWDGEGISIITEKKARDFKAESFSGYVNGHTDEFDFAANLECEKLGARNHLSSI